MIKMIRTKVHSFMQFHCSRDTLRKFRWYRKAAGGLWTRGSLMGWTQVPKWQVDNVLGWYKHHPELYANGKNIEDHRDDNLWV